MSESQRPPQTSVRRRIISHFALILILVFLARLFSHWAEVQRTERIEALRSEYQVVIRLYFDALDSVGTAAHLLAAPMRGDGAVDTRELAAARERVARCLEEIRRRAAEPSIQEILGQTQGLYTQVMEATDRVVAVIGAESSGTEETLAALTHLWTAGSQFMDAMLALAEEGTDAFESDVNLAQAQSGMLDLINTLIHFLVIVISVILVIHLSRTITRPIHALTAAVDEFARGNLSPVLSIDSGDEFSRLAECFEKMSREIDRMLREGKRISDLSLMVCSTLDMDTIAQRLLNVVRQLTGGDQIALIMESDDGHGWIRHTSRDFDEVMRERIEEFDVARTEDAPQKSLVISVPLIAEGRVVGSLEVRGRKPEGDVAKQTNLVSSLLVSVSMALRNAQFVDALSREKEKVAAKASELSEAYAALERSQRFKSQFLANMSHRLRTPLNSVIGCADLMLGGVLGETGEKQRQALETVKRCGHILLTSIDNILNYSRLEGGDVEMLWGEFDVAQVIGEALETLTATLGDRVIAPRIEIAPEAARWRTDRVKLRFVVHHLIDNAVAATREGAGEVHVTAKCAKEAGEPCLEIAVSDSGRGIEPDRLAKIFEPFQGDQGGTSAGLGLTISRRLVELLGGRLEVESAVGLGSTFTVRIPQHPIS
ncbi:HAMP domain-containing protein [Candidatus Sumerlaeota bacterium]|nr:HAMP domain-containing protein [Candidatus Sumerlaeota bacterium]